MTAEEQRELERLKERFPRIQEIRADSMDMEMAAVLFFAVTLVLLFGGHPWAWLEMFWRPFAALVTGLIGCWFFYTADEEAWAVDRYFSLLQRERLRW
ncbi:MAG: hypothetical protein CEO12_489 [Parcubacteria group bacterium Gr01-1014_46]|nr:MAG: hypothetical protein CEO12_489 [Parcubacteria group bacterium Gr01-1014_46]